MIDDDPEAPAGDPTDDETDPPETAPTTDNAADRGSIRKKRVRARLKEEIDREVVRAAFSTEPGRRERWEILEALGTFEDRFACGPNGFPQPDATWFNLGQQRAGWRLYLSWRRLAREGVDIMLDENEPRLAVAKKAAR